MMAGSKTSSQVPSARESAKLLIAIAIVAAVIFPLSTLLCGRQDGDGVLTALISTQKLTWYFWGQDRLLNFIPALAHPIPDVIWNLRFQLFLRSFFAFLAPIGFLCFLTRSVKTLTVATVLTNCVLALALNEEGLFNLYIQHNPFGTSLVLLASAYAILVHGSHRDIWRWGVATALLFLAYATNFALFIVSLPFLAVVLCFDEENRKRLFVFIILNVVAVLFAHVHAQHFGEADTKLGIAPSLHAMLAGYDAVSARLRWAWVAAFVLVSLGGGFATKAPNRWVTTLLIAGCLALIGILSCSEWAQINNYNIRYYLTFLIGVVTGGAYLLITCLRNAAPFMEKYYGGAAWALLVTTFMVGLHGLSSTPGALVGQPWRQSSEAVATLAEQENVQLVVGGFWDVWPAVFDANAKLQADGKLPGVYGGAQRGHVLRNSLWKLDRSDGGLRAMCFLDSADACANAASNGLKAYLIAAPHSERLSSAAGRPILLLELHFADQNNPPPSVKKWGQVPLTADIVHIVLTAGQAHFDPEHDKVIVPLTFRNQGTTTLTPYGDHAVQLGARLTDEAGNLVNTEYARAMLPPSNPGEEVHAEFDLAGNQLEDHGLSILPVQEGVAWFDKFGVAPIVEGPFHRCSKDEKPWICDATHPLDAK